MASRRLIAFPLILLILLLTSATASQAAPSADLWPRWQAHDAASTLTVDHSAWNEILQRYVTRSGNGGRVFHYDMVSDGDRAKLDRYIEDLSGTSVSRLNRPEQKAFWINLYNALTVQLVLKHYPVETIRDIGGSLFRRGPWRDEIIRVEGVDLHLDDIEHRILRPIWQNPLIHYAVNCAAMGCPDLRPVAFTAANLDELMTEGARDFINHSKGLRVDGGKLQVSRIYKWFGEDFGATEADLITHLKKYATPETLEMITTTTSVSYQSYDWSLNDAGR